MLLSNKSIIKAYVCMFIHGSSSYITENRSDKIHEIKGDDEKGGGGGGGGGERETVQIVYKRLACFRLLCLLWGSIFLTLSCQ